MAVGTESPISQLDRALAAVGELISNIRPEQWSASTPCAEWTVRHIVNHLIGMNRVFAAILAAEPPPPRVDDTADDELGRAYRESATALVAAFAQPGVLDRSYQGPLGVATGRDRLQIRLYDLLAHGWDLAHATAQPAQLPEDLAEQSLSFARGQVSDDDRQGRFGPAQIVAEHASAIEQLVAFLGRPVEARR
jgi:uncharacterized protein (TIGR03086 family)